MCLNVVRKNTSCTYCHITGNSVNLFEVNTSKRDVEYFLSEKKSWNWREWK